MTDTTAFEAAAFRRLVAHLQQRTDVQNIDLMIQAGFCRNCLSNWLQEAAEAAGTPMDKERAREHVYGMPFAEWKARYQREATPERAMTFAIRSGEVGACGMSSFIDQILQGEWARESTRARKRC